MTATAPAATGFGFRQQMARADFTAFRRWYDARCLLVPTARERARTVTSRADAPAEAFAEAA
ncbi:MAG TPA: hypothetical protein VMM55_07965 [Thermohalobaculum sp.]|nr:hypothetical protein [Thermohalobaculum sp.]